MLYQNEAPSLEELREFMKGKGVAIYKLPEKLVIVDKIPRNPVGKILKSLLREELKKELNKNV